MRIAAESSKMKTIRADCREEGGGERSDWWWWWWWRPRRGGGNWPAEQHNADDAREIETFTVVKRRTKNEHAP